MRLALPNLTNEGEDYPPPPNERRHILILEVHERIQLMNLLPQKGGYEALKTIRRQREMLSFTPEEVEILGLKTVEKPNGQSQMIWDPGKVNKVVKDIPIDEYMTNHFRKRLAEIEAKGDLNEHTMSLYEKFVIMYK